MPDNEMGERLARIEARLDALLERLDERHEDYQRTRSEAAEHQRALERRVDVLERWQSYVLGVAAAVGVAAGVLTDWIKGVVRGH